MRACVRVCVHGPGQNHARSLASIFCPPNSWDCLPAGISTVGLPGLDAPEAPGPSVHAQYTSTCLAFTEPCAPPPPNPPILGALRLSTGCVGAIVLRSNAVIAVPPLLNMHTNRLALVSLLPGSSSAIGRGDPWDDDQLTHSLRPSFHVSCAACCASWQPSGPASPPRLEPALAGMAVESVTTLPGPHKAISGLCWRRAPLGRKHKCPIPSRTRLNLSCPSGPAGCM